MWNFLSCDGRKAGLVTITCLVVVVAAIYETVVMVALPVVVIVVVDGSLAVKKVAP